MSSKLSRASRLLAEPLESRQMLSVSAHVSGVTLFISDPDHDDDDVEVVGTGTANQFDVIDKGTTDTTQSFSNVRNIVVYLDSGEDQFDLRSADVQGYVCIKSGSGNDDVDVGEDGPVTIGGSLTVNLGSGNNEFGQANTTVRGCESICAGNGDDEVSLGETQVTVALTTPAPTSVTVSTSNVTIYRSFSVNLGDGNNEFEQSSTTVRGCETVCAGRGNDEVSFGPDTDGEEEALAPTIKALQLTPTDGSLGVTICGSLSVNLGSGTNTFVESDTTVKGCETICAGNGDDDIHIGPPLDPPGYDVNIGGSLTLNLGSGHNTVDQSSTYVKQSETINGGSDVDDINFHDAGTVTVTMSLATPTLQPVPSGQGVTIGGNLTVNLDGGQTNSFTGFDVNVGGSMYLNAGPSCWNSWTRRTSSTTTNPDNTIELYQSNIHCDAVFALYGSGNQNVDLNGVEIGHLLAIKTGGGEDSISIRESSADKLQVCTDGGKDDVTLDDTNFRTAKVSLGSGDDSLTVTNSTIHDAYFDGGPDTDTYTDGGGNNITNLHKVNFEINLP